MLIPARDAEDALAALLPALPRRELRTVIVVDNGSMDHTGRVAQEAGAVVAYEPRHGLGAACLRGLAHLAALPVPPDVVVFLDPNVPGDAPDILRVVQPIADGRADLVIASRGRPSAPIRERVGNRVATGLIRALYGHRYSDLGPFRAIRYPALVALDLTGRDESFMVEMQVKALKVGLRVVEVPVDRHLAPAGTVPPARGVLGTVEAGYKILYTILRHSTAR